MKKPQALANQITEMVAEDSFKLFNDKKFRKLVNLESFEQVEQDRIFNEIVVSGLCLGVLMFETLSVMAKNNELRQYYLESQIETESRYGSWLKEIGSEPKFADLWKPLIKMRVDEYRQDYKKNKKYFEDKAKRNPWIFVIAIGGYDHIKRGKGKPEDPFFIMFLHWSHATAEKIARSIAA